MPYILVRNSMNVERLPCIDPPYRVVDDAFGGTTTYIDFNDIYSRNAGPQTRSTLAEAIMKELTAVESGYGCLETSSPLQYYPRSWLSTKHPPFVVLDKLQELGFTVNAVNTVGVTTAWTLQGTPNHQRIASSLDRVN